MKQTLTHKTSPLYHYANGKFVDGPNPNLSGNCSYLSGNCSDLRGIVRELQAEITRLQATAARVERIRESVSYLMADGVVPCDTPDCEWCATSRDLALVNIGLCAYDEPRDR